MAAPADVTTATMTGTYVMNKNLSDSSDKIFELQGMRWLLRKAIGLATITLHVKHYKDDKDVEHIDIKQTLTGGIEGTQENRTMDWTERSHEDKIFGHVVGKSRRLQVDQLENEFFQSGWLPDTVSHGVVNAYVESDTEKSGRTWTAEQVWGFEDINGERRYVRRVNFTSGDTNIRVKLIYDYAGKLEE